MAGTCCIASGVVVILLSLLLGIGGTFFFEYGYISTVKSGVKDNLIVSSKHSPQYAQWAEEQIFNATYYIYNLTNLDEVMQGGKANYSLVGPYSYVQHQPLENVTFLEKGNKVQYQMRTYFTENTASNVANGVDPRSDMVININPALLAALQTAGGIDNLFVGLGSGAVFDRYFRWADQNLGNFSMARVNPSILSQRVSQTVGDLVKLGMSQEEAYATFLSVWANATRIPTNYTKINWEGLLVSQGRKNASGLTVEQASKLLNLNESLSLLNPQNNSWISWGWTLNGNTTYASTVFSKFSLSQRQSDLLVRWLFNYTTSYAAPYLIDKYNLTELSDLAYSQYINYYGPLGNSISSMNPPVQYYWDLADTPIEGNQQQQGPFTFDVKQARYIFKDGPLALRNQTNYIGFIQYAQNFPSSFKQYNLSTNDAFNLFSNFMSYSTDYSPDFFTKALKDGGTGLFLKRSVHEWLFVCSDVVIQNLQPDPICQLQVNNTLMLGPSTIYTGKKNISQIQQYIVWQGFSQIDNIWQGNASIVGKTEYGQFNPFLSVNDTITVWDDNTLRPITFKHDDNYTINGILTYDFYMINETFANNSFYNEPTIPGVANMTTFHQGAPIYLGFYDLIGVPEKYSTDKINGLKQNMSDAITHIRVEPWTGRTLGAKKRLQINSFMSAADKSRWFTGNYDLGYENVTDDLFFPILQIELSGQATSEQTQQIKDSLYLALKLRWPLFWTFLGVGCGLFAVGFICIFCGVNQKKNSHYTRINN